MKRKSNYFFLYTIYKIFSAKVSLIFVIYYVYPNHRMVFFESHLVGRIEIIFIRTSRIFPPSFTFYVYKFLVWIFLFFLQILFHVFFLEILSFSYHRTGEEGLGWKINLIFLVIFFFATFELLLFAKEKKNWKILFLVSKKSSSSLFQ